jgi:hypothetical protein
MRTVNLSILTTPFPSQAKEGSNYKRLQSFLREFEMPYAQLALFLVKLLGVPGPYVLALDRTNWKVGAVDLYILMLSIVDRGIGIPVVWIVLSKSGASDTGEPATIMEIFLVLFGAHNVACLLGDREFVSGEWFGFLKLRRIKFQTRLRKNSLVCNWRGQYAQAWRLFCRTRINCPWSSPKRGSSGAWNST